jgi:NAD(P)-dependent dehydrogenase (short-subunit alcohol dehydrogenase family)
MVRPMKQDLAGQVALVTGAASGIGAASAALLAARGAAVLGTDIRPLAGQFGHDVTDPAAWDAAIAECVARHGRIDILVSNAGTADFGTIIDMDMTRLRQQARVHVEGAFLGSRAAIAQMRAQGRPATGSIILIASIAGLKPIMQTTTYGTAKAAMINLAAALGQEMQAAGDAIRVNAICPGGTRTAMTEEAFGGDEYWDRPDSFAKLPLKDYARADDVAQQVAFLASPDAATINAAHHIVDGGWVLTA